MHIKQILSVIFLLFLFPLPVTGMNHGNRLHASDCDFNKGTCTRTEEISGLEITLDINPKPLTVMSELQFNVSINNKGMPVSNAETALYLTMPGMFMGKNEVLLKHSHGNNYEGSGIIPYCSSGAKTWMAEVKANIDHIMHSARYVFKLK